MNIRSAYSLEKYCYIPPHTIILNMTQVHFSQFQSYSCCLEIETLSEQRFKTL